MSETFPKRVMICDDERVAIQALADHLQAEGLEVEVTEWPQDCLEAAKRRRFDLFILDMRLGDHNPEGLRDGLELAQALWKQDLAVNVPIVGITAHWPEWRERALGLGLVNYFVKPFDPLEIIPGLLKLIASRTEARQAMASWLEQTRGENWHVLELIVDGRGTARLRSNLVAGEGLIELEGHAYQLALKLLHLGKMDQELFEELGGRLQRGLFPPQVNVGFHQHRLLSQLAERSTRLLLRIEDERWRHLPWEYCRYVGGPESGHWLGADQRLTCARVATNAGHFLGDDVLPLPLKVLVVGASPEGTARIDLGRELQELESALAPLGERNVAWRRLGPPELKTDGEASPERVNHELAAFQPHIVHFMCHSAAEALILERDEMLRPWSDYFLSFDLVGSGIKLLVLNGCLSAHPGSGSGGVALSGARAGVASVVGNFFPVADSAAIRFTGLLYGALARGAPLDLAVQGARRTVWAEELEAGRSFLPVLFVRDRFLRIAVPSSGNDALAEPALGR